MILFYITLLILTFWGASFRRKEEECLPCFDKATTVAINGLAIAIVAIRHVRGTYLEYKGFGFSDGCFALIDDSFRQLLVVTFLFYSGFGVVEQIKSKGESYVQAFPKKRIFVTWANFAVAVAFFGVANLILGNNFSVKHFAAALVFLGQIGNPAWYIACILWCYTMVYLVAKVTNKFMMSRYFAGVGMMVGTFLWVGVSVMLKGYNTTFWYNTVTAFAMGAVISIFKEEVTKCIKRFYWPILAVSIAGFLLTYNINWHRLAITHDVVTLFFMSVVLLLACKIKIGNPVLNWLGSHIFPIYIYEFLIILVIKGMLPHPDTPVAAIVHSSLIFFLTFLTAKFYDKWRIVL